MSVMSDLLYHILSEKPQEVFSISKQRILSSYLTIFLVSESDCSVHVILPSENLNSASPSGSFSCSLKE